MPKGSWSAAVLSLVVLVFTACTIGSTASPPTVAPGSPTPSSGSPDPPSEQPPPTARATPQASPAHYATGDIGFDYPADWVVHPSGVQMHYITILAFIGTVPSAVTCTTTSTSTTSSTRCDTDLALQAGDVSLEVLTQDGPPRPDPFTLAASPDPETTVVQVDGAPAFLREERARSPSTTSMLSLTVPHRSNSYSGTILRAWFRDPAGGPRDADVRRVFASVHYEPPLSPTSGQDPSIGAALVARSLSAWAASDEGYACFPSQSGKSRQSVIRQFPHHAPLRQPLPVACSIEVRGTALEMWRLDFRVSWEAAVDRAAGEVSWWTLLSEHGLTTGGMGMDDSTIPYWP